MAPAFPWVWFACLAAAVFSAYGIGFLAGREDARDACPVPVWGYVETQEALERLERRMVQTRNAVAYWRSWRDFTEYRAKRAREGK